MDFIIYQCNEDDDDNTPDILDITGTGQRFNTPKRDHKENQRFSSLSTLINFKFCSQSFKHIYNKEQHYLKSSESNIINKNVCVYNCQQVFSST